MTPSVFCGTQMCFVGHKCVLWDTNGPSVFCGTQITAVSHLQSSWLHAAPTHIWMYFVYPPFSSRICIGHHLHTRSCGKCWGYQPEYKLVLDLKKSAALLLRELTKSL